MANCPVCPSAKLSATELSVDLYGLGCSGCGGLLLDLTHYRRWRDTHADEVAPATGETIATDGNTSKTCPCPKCRGVMTKYRFSVDSNAQLDFCYHCEEIWFDKGEWALLIEMSLTDELTQIFTRPWQRSLLEERISRRDTERWQQRFGKDYEKVKDTAQWIKTHPQKLSIFAYLSAEMRRK